MTDRERIIESFQRAHAADPDEFEEAYVAYVMAGALGCEVARRKAVCGAEDVGQALLEHFGPHVPLPWWMRTGGCA